MIIKKEVEKLNYLLLYNHNTQVIIVDWSSYFGPNGRLACRCHDDKITILKKTLSQKVTLYNTSLISCNKATKSEMHTCMHAWEYFNQHFTSSKYQKTLDPVSTLYLPCDHWPCMKIIQGGYPEFKVDGVGTELFLISSHHYLFLIFRAFRNFCHSYSQITSATR